MAVLLSWASRPVLVDRFAEAWACLRRLFPRRRLGRTYQGLIKNLLPRSAALVAEVGGGLRQELAARAGTAWRTQGWIALAVDGSRFELPRTAALEAAVGRCGQDGSGPQLMLTTIYHLGSGVPWSWVIQTAPGDERGALRQMLGGLPERALLLMDAGFSGYDLLQEVVASGRHFLLRVGAGVELLAKLGWAYRESEATIYLWPDHARRAGQPPLTLRLIVRGRGPKKVYLLTDLRDPRVLSDAQAGRLYRLRWGVEVFYRGLKQVMEHRRLRSRTLARARIELDWLMIGAMLLSLLHLRSLLAARHAPGRASFATALRTVRHAMAAPHARGLGRTLARCLKDAYRRRRSKAARHWPHKKKEQRCRAPRVRRATTLQIHAAQDLHAQQRAA